jgi:hypothetical protein
MLISIAKTLKPGDRIELWPDTRKGQAIPCNVIENVPEMQGLAAVNLIEGQAGWIDYRRLVRADLVFREKD